MWGKQNRLGHKIVGAMLFTCILLWGGIASATIVSPGLGTLSSAIASEPANGTLELNAGTYTESAQININKNLTIKGAAGTNSTNVLIDGGGSPSGHRIFYVSGGAIVNLEGLTIQNGYIGVDDHGAGVYVNASYATFTDCRIVGNIINAPSGGGGAGIMINPNAEVTINNCLIKDNQASSPGWGRGGGIWNNWYSTVYIANSIIEGNVASNPGATGGWGGGISNHSESNMIILDSIISGNVASWAAGGLSNMATSNMIVKNCLIVNNIAEHGAGIGNWSDIQLINCTLADNAGGQAGGAFLAANGAGQGIDSFSLVNCIIWGNGFNSISKYSGVSFNMSYSDDETGDHVGVSNNISVDPQFGENYSLSFNSPAIDAGTSSGAPSDDLIGNARPGYHAYDIGAYEYVGGIVLNEHNPVQYSLDNNPSEIFSFKLMDENNLIDSSTDVTVNINSLEYYGSSLNVVNNSVSTTDMTASVDLTIAYDTYYYVTINVTAPSGDYQEAYWFESKPRMTITAGKPVAGDGAIPIDLAAIFFQITDIEGTISINTLEVTVNGTGYSSFITSGNLAVQDVTCNLSGTFVYDQDITVSIRVEDTSGAPSFIEYAFYTTPYIPEFSTARIASDHNVDSGYGVFQQRYKFNNGGPITDGTGDVWIVRIDWGTSAGYKVVSHDATAEEVLNTPWTSFNSQNSNITDADLNDYVYRGMTQGTDGRIWFTFGWYGGLGDIGGFTFDGTSFSDPGILADGTNIYGHSIQLLDDGDILLAYADYNIPGAAYFKKFADNSSLAQVLAATENYLFDLADVSNASQSFWDFQVQQLYSGGFVMVWQAQNADGVYYYLSDTVEGLAEVSSTNILTLVDGDEVGTWWSTFEELQNGDLIYAYQNDPWSKITYKISIDNAQTWSVQGGEIDSYTPDSGTGYPTVHQADDGRVWLAYSEWSSNNLGLSFAIATVDRTVPAITNKDPQPGGILALDGTIDLRISDINDVLASSIYVTLNEVQVVAAGVTQSTTSYNTTLTQDTLGRFDISIAHNSPFPENTDYSVTISAEDATGNSILETYSFVSELPASVNNIIQHTGHDSIAEAVASANADDVIELQAGEYKEGSQININKNLTIKAADGVPSADIVLDGNNAHRLFEVQSGATFTLQGITLKNGYAAGHGGGIYISNGYLVMTEAKAMNNTATGYGGFLYIPSGRSAQTYHCWFEGNTATSGGGAVCNWYGTYTGHQNVISANVHLSGGQGYGGAGVYNRGTYYGNNNLFIANIGASWGGAVSNYYATYVGHNNIFKANRTGGWGGGVFLYYGSYTGYNNVFMDNYCYLTSPSIHNEKGTYVGDNNLFFENINYRNFEETVFGQANSIYADPLFMDEDNDNFYPQLHSPLINAGYGSIAVTNDIRDIPRGLYPSSPGFDIGIYEYDGVFINENNPARDSIGNIEQEVFTFRLRDRYNLIDYSVDVTVNINGIEYYGSSLNVQDNSTTTADMIITVNLTMVHDTTYNVTIDVKGVSESIQDVYWFVPGRQVYKSVNNITQGTWYYKITAAVVSANPGDIIELLAGTYQENKKVDLGKDLIIRGASGTNSTNVKIDGAGTHRAFDIINGASVTVSGLTIQNGFDNFLSTSGGGIRLTSGELYMENSRGISCDVENRHGGFLYVPGGTAATLNRCYFEGNTAHWGGAVQVRGTLHARHTIFRENTATMGGGVFNYLSAAKYYGLNNIYDSNLATNTSGSGVYNSGTYKEENSTFYNNSGRGVGQYGGSHTAVNNIYHSTVIYGGSNVTYSCYYPGSFSGVGNIFADPLFKNAVAGDFRLQDGSPCIDKGDSAVIDWNYDLAYEPRIMGAAVEMGALEYHSPALSELIPERSSVNVSIHEIFSFRIKDNEHPSSDIGLTVNINGVEYYGSSLNIVDVNNSAVTTDFRVSVDLVVEYDVTYNVTMNISCPTASYEVVYWFAAEPNNPPVISNRSPYSEQLFVTVSPVIVFDVTDTTSLVDINTLQLLVNDVDVTSEVISGSITDGYSVTYDPSADFNFEDMVYVTINVSDDLGKAAQDTYWFKITKEPFVYNQTQGMKAYGAFFLALNEADPGDVLVVTPGVHDEDQEILVSIDITITSTTGERESVKVDGGSSHRIFKIENNATVTISYLTIQNGYLGSSSLEGAGVLANSGTTLVADNVIFDKNTMPYSIGDLRGGAIAAEGATTYINNCIFKRNKASRGAAIYMSNSTIKNSLFFDNESNRGILTDLVANIINCTFYGNSYNGNNNQGNSTAILVNRDTSNAWSIKNSIFWNNYNYNSPGTVQHFYNLNGVITYSDVQPANNGYGGLTSANCIEVSPKLYDINANDLKLKADSPCIDTGDDSASVGSYDLAGNARRYDGDFNGTALIDMGAYESYSGLIIDEIPYIKNSDKNTMQPFTLRIRDLRFLLNESADISININNAEYTSGSGLDILERGSVTSDMLITVNLTLEEYAVYQVTINVSSPSENVQEVFWFSISPVAYNQTKGMISYAYIKDAIAAASANDTIIVTAGVHDAGEVLVIDKDLVLSSAAGIAGDVYIDGGWNGVQAEGVPGHRLFQINSGIHVTFNGLILQNAVDNFAGSSSGLGGGSVVRFVGSSNKLSLISSIVSNNYAHLVGQKQAIIYAKDAALDMYIKDTIFANNRTNGHSVIFGSSGGQVTAINSLFNNNQMYYGGVIHNVSFDGYNCTFADNHTEGQGGNDNNGAVFAGSSGVINVYNTLIWGNTSDGNYNVVGNGNQDKIFNAEYCAIQNDDNGGGGTWSLSNCVSLVSAVDPFVDSANDDYHLPTSPEISSLIDAGEDSFVEEPYDLEGNERIQGLYVDMGAYEASVSNPGNAPIAFVIPYDSSPTHSYRTIIAAVAAAATGDTILIVTGDPHIEAGTVTINKDLIIGSVAGGDASNVIIDGGWDGSAGTGQAGHKLFIVDGASLTLNNLTLQNGYDNYAQTGSGYDGGGVIFARNGSEISIISSVLTHNYSAGGGGVLRLRNGSDLYSVDNIYANNDSDSYGGGGGVIYIPDSGTKIYTERDVYINNTARKGAVFSDRNGNALITARSCLYYNNSASYSGILHNIRYTGQNCTFADNHSTGSGGSGNSGTIFSGNGLNIAIYNSIFFGNTNAGNTHTIVGSNDNNPPDGQFNIYDSAIQSDDTQDGTTWTTSNIIILTEDPFVNSVSENYRLPTEPTLSALIDIGDNSGLSLADLDLSGGPRVIGYSVDLGAYESSSENPTISPNALVLHNDTTSYYTTVIAAVEIAAPGDIVQVFAGTHFETSTITINKDLTIEALPSEDVYSVIIDGSGDHRIFVVTDNAVVTINELTIQNGRPASPNSSGAAFWISPGVKLNLISIIASGNDSTAGFSNNDGGVVYVSNYSNDATINATNSLFIGNTADDGGVAYYGVWTVNNCQFIENSTTSSAGGVSRYSDWTVSNSKFIRNYSFYDGAVDSDSNWYVKNSIFIENGNGNHEWSEGGVFDDGNYVLENCTFAGNYGRDGSIGSWKIEANNCIFWNNINLADAGGVSENLFATWTHVTLNNCLISSENYIPAGHTASKVTSNIIIGDPLFVDTNSEDYHLQDGPAFSPAIDIGDNSIVVSGDVDLDGDPRIQGWGVVDLGAYESPLGYDPIPPYFVSGSFFPTANEDVPSSTIILSAMKDDLSGISNNSLAIYINDVLVAQTITIADIVDGITVTYDPTTDFTWLEIVNVTINIRDRAGNLASYARSFTIESTTPSITLKVFLQGYYNPDTGISKPSTLNLQFRDSKLIPSSVSYDVTINAGGLSEALEFSGLPIGNYYILISHQLPGETTGVNHIPILLDNVFPYGAGPLTIDLTTQNANYREPYVSSVAQKALSETGLQALKTERGGNLVIRGGNAVRDDYNVINVEDLAVFTDAWKNYAGAGSVADFNADGVVDTLDFAIWSSNNQVRYPTEY
ncbi:choice-of-anchor Q domain-containing protein [Candidatus Margulisiibacteriota bacterium]